MENYLMVVRKFSWWKSAGLPLRTFVIAELHYDHDADGLVYFTKVGLLEVGFDFPKDMPYQEFCKLYEDKRLLPVNVLPVANSV